MEKTTSRLAIPTNGRAAVASAIPRAEQEQPGTGATEQLPRRLTWRVSAYIALVTAVAAACIAIFASDAGADGWQGLLTLVFLAVVFERVGIKIYGDTHISAGVVALFAIAVVYGVQEVAVAAPLVVLAAEALTASPWYRRLFNMSSYALANICAALVFHALIDVDAGVSGWWVPAALAAILINYGLNVSFVTTAVHLYTEERWLTVWRDEHQWLFPYYIVFGLLGVALAAAYLALEVPGIMAFVAPPLMMRFALHQYVTKTEQTVLELKQKNLELEAANQNIMEMTVELTETYDGTLEALVLALDARDRETKGHSLRVASYVMAIAREMGIEPGSKDWTDMQRGALLHDVGKIGVPDYILHKPGPLTPEEWDDMKRHPRIGDEMLHEISFLSGAAEIVHTHHERFDGKGYPSGLAGEEIPLGARIFAAADAFDAMTSDRPYRKALPPEMARDEILRHSGTQFDPEVVQAFLLVYDKIEKIALAGYREEHARAA